MTASPTERFAQRHGYIGLDSVIKQDLGTLLIPSRSSRARSPSPRIGNKRGPSIEPHSVEHDRNGGLTTDVKRMKQFHEGSPAPSSNGGGGDRPSGLSGWRGGRDEVGGGGGGGGGGGEAFDRGRGEIARRRPLDNGPPVPRVIPYALDARGDVTAVLPDAVVFFLSILPGPSSFNGAFPSSHLCVSFLLTIRR
jgi:cleavage stimulation factor subunit 3